MTMSTQGLDGRLDRLRAKAVEAWFERAPEEEIERIVAEVEREYGAAEASRLREDLERVHAKVPSWLRYLVWLERTLPRWKLALLCIVVFLVAMILSVLLGG